MKPILRHLLFATPFLLLADSAPGADDGAPRSVDKDVAGQVASAIKIETIPATKLIGQEVRNEQDARIAKIEDLLIDLENGRVVQVVLSGDKDHLAGGRVGVPPQTLSYVSGGNSVKWRGDPEKLRSAPGFPSRDSGGQTQQEHAAAVYRHYGEEPYFAVSEDGSATPSKAGGVHAHGKMTVSRASLGHLFLARKLMKLTVRDAMDEKVGGIEDVIVDLSGGRVVVLVVSSGGFLGVRDTLSALPPSAVRYTADNNDQLLLTVSKETLKNAPPYNAKEADRFNDGAFTDKVYRSYNAGSYSGTDAADNTRRNKRDRDSASLTPLDQSNSPEDVGITARIRQGIRARDGLSVNARNVKIITRDGHVTLRGPVRTAEEKKFIEEVAAREAGAPGRVVSQLEVIAQSSP
jgi:sporulation protein YlmC with PRC-barrel domain